MESISKLEESEENQQEYLNILKALKELPFNVGKNLLIDFLKGDYKNKSIINNNLDQLENFDSVNWQKEKIAIEIDKLIRNGMIEQTASDYNKFIKILRITPKGLNEIRSPTLSKFQLKNRIEFKRTKITEDDRENFKVLESFLEKFNDEQKKAIISNSKEILCIAGAGSGKTTVLTKRIEFLVKYKGVQEEKILAITFTRKARQEMKKRLLELGIKKAHVETFNSFCEKLLQRNEQRIYGRRVRVQTYADKILAMNLIMSNLGVDPSSAINSYFTKQQRKFKTESQLSNSFMNDCFSVMEYLKLTNERELNVKNKDKNAEMIKKIVKALDEHMNLHGLRDYSDQLIDAVEFLKNNPQEIPFFEHVLIDEYQDVNEIQINLLELLKKSNIFAVGDPRQSIFGWRGSDVSYILEFEKKYPSAEIIHLTKNYRSRKNLVEFMNKSIREMGLPDLEHKQAQNPGSIGIYNFETEDEEREFIIEKIFSSKNSRDKIFVLARTNRQLLELSQKLSLKGIAHIVKTDEIKNPTEAKSGELVLATIHAIKGLQAKEVFVMGCNEQNFPCKASDHPAVEMLKKDNYDKEEEERRLFYVAISRAKDSLHLTYSGKKKTYFISEEMEEIVNKVSK